MNGVKKFVMPFNVIGKNKNRNNNIMLVQLLVFIVFLIGCSESEWICTDGEHLDLIGKSNILTLTSIDCQMYNSDGCVENSTVCTCWTGFTGRKCDQLDFKVQIQESDVINFITWLIYVLVSNILILQVCGVLYCSMRIEHNFPNLLTISINFITICIFLFYNLIQYSNVMGTNL